MKAKELIQKSLPDLKKLATKVKKELADARRQALEQGKLDIQKIRTLRKDYARILTVINQKERSENA